jgi:hypothetical protein
MVRSQRFKGAGRAFALLGVLLTVLPAGAVPALGAPAWSRPTAIARLACGLRTADAARVVQNARGDVLVVWVEHCGQQGIVALSRRAGHRFGRPRTLAHIGGNWVVWLQAAIDSRGGAVVAWERPTISSSSSKVYVATRAPAKPFGRPLVVDRAGEDPSLALAPDGAALLAWERLEAPPPVSPGQMGLFPIRRVVAATRAAGSPRFGHSRTLSTTQPATPFGSGIGAMWPAAALAPDGTAVVAWARYDGNSANCCTAVEAATRRPGGRFNAPVRFPTPIDMSQFDKPVVGIGSDGGPATIAWPADDRRTLPGPSGLFAVRWDGGAAGDPVTLVAPATNGHGMFSPQLLLAPDGSATVAWDDGERACAIGHRHAVTLAADGSAGAPRQLTPVGSELVDTATTLDRAGRLVAAWLHVTASAYDRYGYCTPLGSRLEGTLDGVPLAPGPEQRGRFGTIDSAGGSLDLAGAPGQRTLAVWTARARVMLTTLRP